MGNLIKSDFKRVLKDKLFLVVCILGIVFALITPLLYMLIVGGADSALELLPIDISAKTNFFESFAPGNNLGLIAPVLLAIILCKDFSFGTVRNKIIAGKTRTSIFMSMYVVCFVVLWAVILLHALLTLTVSLLFFDYQSGGFHIEDFWYLMESIAFEVLIYLFIAALICWLCATMKNVGLVIVLFVAINFVLTMVASILQLCVMFLEADAASENTLNILKFLQKINIFNYSLSIGTGTKYTTEDVLYNTLVPVLSTAALLTLGCVKFNRKDLK